MDQGIQAIKTLVVEEEQKNYYKNSQVKKSLGNKFHNQLIPQFVKKRHKLKISQMELDNIIGVATGLVSKWEVGIRNPSGYLFLCWADALHCELWLKEKRK